MHIKKAITKVAQRLGFDIIRRLPEGKHLLPPDLSEEDGRIVLAARPFTMTSVDRIAAVIDAVRHVSRNAVPGAIVECGVWRGGSIMAALMTLASLGDREREVFLYDTFEGMPEPTEDDVSYDGRGAVVQFAESRARNGSWCAASLEDVAQNVGSTGYPSPRIHLVRGKVEDTIPATLPASIALLRLDTDWYESTRHELEHLFPLLHPRGVLIVDDYGHWAGARKAVDEFFQRHPGQYFFHRIDYTARSITRIGV